MLEMEMIVNPLKEAYKQARKALDILWRVVLKDDS